MFDIWKIKKWLDAKLGQYEQWRINSMIFFRSVCELALSWCRMIRRFRLFLLILVMIFITNGCTTTTKICKLIVHSLFWWCFITKSWKKRFYVLLLNYVFTKIANFIKQKHSDKTSTFLRILNVNKLLDQLLSCHWFHNNKCHFSQK